MSILITTYEGNHNHHLPISASAMASTTTAVASMLTIGSSTSNFAIKTQPNSVFNSSSASIAGLNSSLNSLNFDLSNHNSRTPLHLLNTTISPSYSTITLDLTVPPPSTTQTTQPNFFSSNSNFGLPVPSSWSNKRYMSYAPHQPYNSKYAQNMARPMNQSSLTDSVAMAITSNLSFHSAIQAAITSYVGATGNRGNASSVVYEQNNGGKTYGDSAAGSVPSSSSAQKGGLDSPLMAMSRSKDTVSGASSVDMIRWENMK